MRVSPSTPNEGSEGQPSGSLSVVIKSCIHVKAECSIARPLKGSFTWPIASSREAGSALGTGPGRRRVGSLGWTMKERGRREMGRREKGRREKGSGTERAAESGSPLGRWAPCVKWGPHLSRPSAGESAFAWEKQSSRSSSCSWGRHRSMKWSQRRWSCCGWGERSWCPREERGRSQRAKSRMGCHRRALGAGCGKGW